MEAGIMVFTRTAKLKFIRLIKESSPAIGTAKVANNSLSHPSRFNSPERLELFSYGERIYECDVFLTNVIGLWPRSHRTSLLLGILVKANPVTMSRDNIPLK